MPYIFANGLSPNRAPSRTATDDRSGRGDHCPGGVGASRGERSGLGGVFCLGGNRSRGPGHLRATARIRPAARPAASPMILADTSVVIATVAIDNGSRA